jgi:periplasmic copper chaperone A
MKHLWITVTILALLCFPAKGGGNDNLMIMNAVAPAALVPTATSAVVYLDVMNHGSEADALVSVSSPRARSATLHESYVEADVAKMKDLPRIDLPAGATVELKQGGMHIMLTGLDAALKEGDVLSLELTFEKTGRLPVTVTVGKAAGDHLHGSGG